jgi:hypothetical protein
MKINKQDPNRGAERKTRQYEWMPASIDSTDKALSIGVKYEKNAKFEAVKHRSGIIMRFPDRTLYCLRSFVPSHERMIDVSLDEVVEMDIFTNKSLLGEMGFKYAMVNSSAVPTTYHYDDYDAESQKLWPLIVSDSGGFQLHSGAEEFLDPHEIVETHNKVCDVGICLDIPLPHKFQKDLLIRAAHVQKANTEIFLKHKRKSLSILNVIHGSTFYLRDKYREVVEDDRMDLCALGGMKTLDLIPLVLHMIHVMTSGKKYNQYHALGVSGLERWTALSYLGHKKIAKLITSDSSSYIQCGINMQYFEPKKLLSTLTMGDYCRKNNAQKLLHCSCPVCSVVKYAHALGLPDNSIGYRGIQMHNLYANRGYLDELWDLGAQTKEEILSYLRPYFNSAKLKNIGLTLSAIDMALEHKAADKYAPYMNKKFIETERKGLFTVSANATDVEADKFKHFDNMIKRYEKFHK